MGKTQNKRLAWSPDSQHLYMLRRIERACAGNRPMLRAFGKWLAESRGLEPGSITVRVGSACSFVDAVTTQAEATCAQAFRRLSAGGVEDFFVGYCKDHGPAARRSMRSAMRLFLTFAAERGWVGWELADAVPSLLGYRLSNLPRGLSDEHLS